MANKIAAKIKRKRLNKKIDDLYQECLCIYFSININSTVTDITLPNDNRNKNDRLNLLLKKNNNLEYLSNEFVKWKGSINELKARLTKKFGEKNITKAEKFLKVLNLIENIIAIQEDTVKRLNTTKVNEEEMNNDKSPVNLSDFAFVFESCSNTLYQDHHICTEYAENSNLDYNKLKNEITMLINQITNEINEATNDVMIINNDQITPINSYNNNTNNNNNNDSSSGYDNTTVTSLQPRVNGTIAMSMANSMGLPHYDPSNSNHNQSFIDSDDAIIETSNPNKLFFNISSLSLSTKDIKTHFEKFFKTNKFDILPRYNYKKMLGCSYDINSPEYDFENIFFKVFPPIYVNDTTLKNRTLLDRDREIDSYHPVKTKKKKSPRDIELLAQYDKITPLQKVTYLWAISLYGANPSLINAITNIFECSHNVRLGTEEVMFIIENVLDEIGVDLFGSNLNLLTQSNYSPIYNLIEPSIQIGATSNFNYNSQLADYIKGNITTLKNDKGIKEKYNLATYSFGNIQRNPKEHYDSLSFINRNPLFKNKEKNAKMYQDVKNQMMAYCDKIEYLFNKSVSKYDYYNMTRLEMNSKTVTISQVSNKINASLSFEMNNGDKNEKMTKENLLKQFNNTTSDMSNRALSEKVLDSTQLKLQAIFNVVSFFSKDEIESEWKAMRTPWYQNNTVFRPKQKRPQIPITAASFPPNVRPNYFPNQYHPNPVTSSGVPSTSSSTHCSNYF